MELLAMAENARLWFDVERRYKTMYNGDHKFMLGLWFDVERRYKTIKSTKQMYHASCGLM